MFPILFQLGPIMLRTINVFAVIAFIWAGFLFWRKAREEHYQEDQVIDGYLLAFLLGLVAARIGHIIVFFNQYGFNVSQWLNPVAHPGGLWWVGLVAASIYLAQFASSKKWDVFEVLDFWFMAVAAGLSILSIGMFFDGGGAGLPTNLPIGISFPGVIDSLHPVQLYWAVIYSCLGWYLSWAEYKYRTYLWYRSGKKAAQTGYLTSVFVIVVGFFGLVLQPITAPMLQLGGMTLDYYFHATIFLWGLGMLYVRSGRSLPFIKA